MQPDKAVLGKRYTCFQCGTKFYDLNREEPTCPSCGSDQRDDPNPAPHVLLLSKLKAERKRARAAPKKGVKPSREEEIEEEDDDLEDIEDDGDDDLDDDDDDDE